MHFQGDASLGLAGEGRFSGTVLLFCPCHLTSTCSHRGLGDHTIGGGVQGKPHKWLVGRVRPTPTSPHWWGHWTTPPLPHQLSCAAWGVSPPPPRVTAGWRPRDRRRLVAYHEAGHALVGVSPVPAGHSPFSVV